MQKIYEVKCKFCGKAQQVATSKEFPIGIYKKCAYCEKRWIIHHHPGKTTILRRIK